MYDDSWGLIASSSDARWIFDLGRRFALWPHARFHVQNSVSFWQRAYVSGPAPGWNLPEYRTGDRELGPLWTTEGGFGIKWYLGSAAEPEQWALQLTGDAHVHGVPRRPLCDPSARRARRAGLRGPVLMGALMRPSRRPSAGRLSRWRVVDGRGRLALRRRDARRAGAGARRRGAGRRARAGASRRASRASCATGGRARPRPASVWRAPSTRVQGESAPAVGAQVQIEDVDRVVVHRADERRGQLLHLDRASGRRPTRPGAGRRKGSTTSRCSRTSGAMVRAPAATRSRRARRRPGPVYVAPPLRSGGSVTDGGVLDVRRSLLAARAGRCERRVLVLGGAGRRAHRDRRADRLGGAVRSSSATTSMHRCGSLDCHGQTGRNLRIWGCEGMRLDPHGASRSAAAPGRQPDDARRASGHVSIARRSRADRDERGRRRPRCPPGAPDFRPQGARPRRRTRAARSSRRATTRTSASPRGSRDRRT